MRKNNKAAVNKLGVLMMAALLAGASISVQADSGNPQWQGFSSQDKGTGFGALLGGLVGGPPGLVLGAFGGSLIGRHEGMKDELLASQEELGRLRTQLAQCQQMERQNSADERQSRSVMVANATPVPVSLPVDPMQAIEQGFSMTIHFRTGSDQLESHYHSQLVKLAGQLHKMDELGVRLDGYTDERGSDELNMQLSEKRIATIQALLQENGVESGAIQLRAHGESSRLQANGDSESLHFERRVVISFFKKP